jgi:hypothetical protein
MLSLILLLNLHHYLQPTCQYGVYAANANDDAKSGTNDDQNAANSNNADNDAAEDATEAENYDSSSSNTGKTDDTGYGYGDDTYRIAKVDAEQFGWANGQGFDTISIMPISCINL